MSLIVYLIILAISGLFVGALARLSLPGPDPMTISQTILLGLAGNIIAGVIVWLVWGHRAPGIVLSVACSSLILLAIRRSRGGGLTRPGAPPGMGGPAPRSRGRWGAGPRGRWRR